MKKPIFRIFATYSIKKKANSIREKVGVIDTFVLTNDVERIRKDKHLRERMTRQVGGKNKELEFTFKNIYVEGQYGNTNY